MIKHINDCVGCESIGLHCIGSSCPRRDIRVTVCDICEEESDALYRYDTFGSICVECLIETLREQGKIERSPI